MNLISRITFFIGACALMIAGLIGLGSAFDMQVQLGLASEVAADLKMAGAIFGLASLGFALRMFYAVFGLDTDLR
jgi:hypothetical protein